MDPENLVQQALQAQQQQGFANLDLGASFVNYGTNLEVSNILQGGSIEAAGALFAKQGALQRAVTVQQATSFNDQVASINALRTVNALSDDFNVLTGNQYAAQAGHGFNVNSKSFLLLQDQTINQFQQKIMNVKLDANNTRIANDFESQIHVNNALNEAAGDQFKANMDLLTASTRASQANLGGQEQLYKLYSSAQNKLPSLFSDITGGF